MFNEEVTEEQIVYWENGMYAKPRLWREFQLPDNAVFVNRRDN